MGADTQSEKPSRGNNSQGRGRRDSRDKRKRQDMGRAEWGRTKPDKRARIGDKEPKELPSYATQFPSEEIEAEERKPKRKVAVLIGYSGSGYKGMQLDHTQKTIEGDLFAAFVAAGAISKANANDPKKSSLVRCARTDKGVHAAGNIISLKLIVEDPEIVEKINENLSPQIRVWGIQRTNNAFSCYQMCDSRVYEYLIPTYCFLPPHPSSFLAKKLVQFAEEAGELGGYKERQAEVASFWNDVERERIQPILQTLDATTRDVVMKALYAPERDVGDEPQGTDDVIPVARTVTNGVDAGETPTATNDIKSSDSPDAPMTNPPSHSQIPSEGSADPVDPIIGDVPRTDSTSASSKPSLPSPIEEAAKALRATYLSSKRSFRIPQSRLSRITQALNLYIGTHNYHNYTVAKTHKDPSATRHMKSFTLNPTPLIINGTEWLSLKVHGQSFMMHQIRKMVGMVAMAVRCGADIDKLVNESYGKERMSIPKAPGLGLLLERPVFDTYNKKAENELHREGIDFTRFQGKIDAFRQKEIYERIFKEEDAHNSFHNLFNHIDNWQEPAFLWVTSGGVAAAKVAIKAKKEQSGGGKGVGGAAVDAEFDSDEDENPDGGEG